MGASDASYSCVFQQEDPDGLMGVSLSKQASAAPCTSSPEQAQGLEGSRLVTVTCVPGCSLYSVDVQSLLQCPSISLATSGLQHAPAMHHAGLHRACQVQLIRWCLSCSH